MNVELENKLEDIVKWRRNRRTYRDICGLLAKEGMKTTPGNLHTWLKRQRKKAAKLNDELAVFEAQKAKALTTKVEKPSATLEAARRATERMRLEAEAEAESNKPIWEYDRDEIRRA